MSSALRASRFALRALLVCGLGFFGWTAGALRAQEAAVAGTADSGEELVPAALAIEPIGSEQVDLGMEGAAEVGAVSTEAASVIPRTLVFGIGMGVVFDDNIFLSPTDKESDIVIQAIAGFTWTPRLTDKSGLTLNYEAVGFKYLDHSDLDSSIDHSARLIGHVDLGRTKLGVAGSYQRLSGSNYDFDSAGQYQQIPDQQVAEGDRNADPFTPHDLIGLDATAAVELGGKTSMTLGARYSANLYEDSLQSSNDLSGRLGLGYLITGKTTMGVSGVAGRLDHDNSATENYEQALLTLAYDATGKLAFSGSAGPEFRHNDGDTGGDTTNFVYNLSGRYQWRDKTALSLTGSRSTIGSATDLGSSIERTLIALGVEQKIGDKMVASFSTGYDLSDYQETATAPTGDPRQDSFWTARLSLTYSPNAHTSVGLFYDFRDNNSSQEIDSYRSNRFGMRIGVSF